MEEAKVAAEKLQAAMDADNTAKCLITLSRLSSAPMTVEILQATNLGKMVSKLRKSHDTELADVAARLVKKWRKMADEASGSDTAPKKAVEQSAPKPAKPVQQASGHHVATFDLLSTPSPMPRKPSPGLRPNHARPRSPSPLPSHGQLRSPGPPSASSSQKSPARPGGTKFATADAYSLDSRELESDRRLQRAKEINAHMRNKEYGKKAETIDPALLYNITDQKRIQMEEYHGEDTTERVLGGLDRTKRRYKTVPSLFQLCMNMLVDHCDWICELGSVPADLIDPVFKKCTARQLENIEYYNPHILEDTDHYWEAHCPKQIRQRYQSSAPEHGWREAYMSWRDEGDRKYREVAEELRRRKHEEEEARGKRKVEVLDMHSDLYKHKLGITARKRATGNDRSMLVSRSHGGGSSHGAFNKPAATKLQQLRRKIGKKR